MGPKKKKTLSTQSRLLATLHYTLSPNSVRICFHLTGNKKK